MAAPLSRSSSPSWTFDFAAENFIAPTAQMTSRGNLVPVLRKTLFEPSTYFNGGSRKDCALKPYPSLMRFSRGTGARVRFTFGDLPMIDWTDSTLSFMRAILESDEPRRWTMPDAVEAS